MNMQKPIHTFQIPVMGLAYTIDSPIRVAQYGIDSVISIMDDDLMEKMNAFYCEKFHLPYIETPLKAIDSRAKRITNYLNVVHTIVNQKFDMFKKELTENHTILEQFLAMLPSTSDIRKGINQLLCETNEHKQLLEDFLAKHLHPGAIDVNIMTKVDKDNFNKNEQLPVEFNDAHAALRGFVNSTLNSSVVLSAGMNPRLYSYFEQFEAFYPNLNGNLQKKIILKVSDFRSAMIQGNFLAKKGLWVSEYRIESGLNCGGHAFATDGYLLGTILEEFKTKKNQLVESAHELMVKALHQKGKEVPEYALPLKITVQGGVGTAEEHAFLLEQYKVDSVGWGSPFLLVPEATSVDADTRNLLAKANEEDLFLSHISPLGIPFNTVKGTTNQILKEKRLAANKLGSSCPKKYLALSKEYDEKGTCSASKKFQEIKLEALELQKETLTQEQYDFQKFKITEKSCLCVGLANASYLEHDIKVKGESQGVVICPGPNMAYFDHEVSLQDMVQHIYGSKQVLAQKYRPHFFIKELGMYIDYLCNELNNQGSDFTAPQLKKWKTFKANVLEGINYYIQLFHETSFFKADNTIILNELAQFQSKIETIVLPELVLVG